MVTQFLKQQFILSVFILGVVLPQVAHSTCTATQPPDETCDAQHNANTIVSCGGWASPSGDTNPACDYINCSGQLVSQPGSRSADYRNNYWECISFDNGRTFQWSSCYEKGKSRMECTSGDYVVENCLNGLCQVDHTITKPRPRNKATPTENTCRLWHSSDPYAFPPMQPPTSQQPKQCDGKGGGLPY